MKRLFLVPIICLLQSGFVPAQTIFPDSNLRAVLLRNYPGLFSRKQVIVDSLAQKYQGSIDCSGKNISNITGMEIFTSISTFNCSNNTIADLEPIKSLSKLSVLNCANNLLSSLPDLKLLTNLTVLKCSDNKLTILPDLSSNSSLSRLECFDNKIIRIPGLENLTNLNNLIVYNNKLDSLPDLSRLGKLAEFQCHTNLLKTIPGLENLINLNTFIAGDNDFGVLPDLSKLVKLEKFLCWRCSLLEPPVTAGMRNLTILDLNTNKLKKLPDLTRNINLREFRCTENQVDTIIGLRNLSSLERINVSLNNIRNIDELFASKNSLTELIANNNQITHLPDFSDFWDLNVLLVENNYLSFDDLITPASLRRIQTFIYAPQAPLTLDFTPGFTGRPFVLKINGDKYVKGSIYTWFKNGIFYSSNIIDSLFFPSPASQDSGAYSCMVTNSFLPDLILGTKLAILSFPSCINKSSFSYETEDIICEKGGSIIIDESSINGGHAPFLYTLKSTLLGNSIEFTKNVFGGLYEKNYTLGILDRDGCSAEFSIKLNGKSSSECKSIVIIPGAAQGAEMLLDKPGTAKIYDKSGRLVKSLNTPASWDGSLADGSYLPGQYMVEYNGETFNVTVLK